LCEPADLCCALGVLEKKSVVVICVRKVPKSYTAFARTVVADFVTLKALFDFKQLILLSTLL
jgi:hypothetical protein